VGNRQSAPRSGVDRDPAPSAASAPPAERAAGLDRLVHERVRLGILSALAVSGPLAFSDLKRALQATDGNLSVHARRLEEAGYIECSKSFAKRLPRTEFEITATGRRALTRYLDHMEALIRATRRA